MRTLQIIPIITSREMVQRAVRDMHRRTMLCVAREGRHVEGHGA